MNLANKLQEKVVEYCKKLSHKELQDLVIYLGNGIDDNVKPTKIQKEFCEVFLGSVSYAEYLRIVALPEDKKPFFTGVKRISTNLAELFSFVAWQSNLRISSVLLELANEKVKTSRLELKIAEKELKTAKIKEDIARAVENSYEDGEFYKVEGWCNISDVLVKHKLLKLDE